VSRRLGLAARRTRIVSTPPAAALVTIQGLRRIATA
jgi:hypothetical protein